MSDHRRDRAVILARGASRRMGRPKGLVRFPGRRDCFLEMLLEVYSSLGIPVLVVAGPDGNKSYGPIVGGAECAQLLTADAAGDTARSVGLAWRHLDGAATHLWAHPVDVPEVTPATLTMLLDASRREPERVLRPAWDGRPGHPVILPAQALAALDATLPGGGLTAAEGRMQEILDGLEAAAHPALRTLDVADPKVACDYDAPEDLPRTTDRDRTKPNPGGTG